MHNPLPYFLVHLWREITGYIIGLERICTYRKEKTEKRKVHTMKKIELFEKAIKEEAASLSEYGINGTLFWAYRDSIRAGNDSIDFAETIWDRDIEEITKCLKENGITEFTISSTFSSLIPTLAEFEKHGFKMAGLTEVRAKYTDLNTGKNAVIPAIRMQGI